MDNLWHYCGSWSFCDGNFIATGAFTMIGHGGDHCSECKLETTSFREIELCNGLYQDWVR
jgi:hypothetical protein